MTRRLVVLGVMPKRRKDSAILGGVRFLVWGGVIGEARKREGPTLLFGLNEKTISECTFRLRSLFSMRSFTARYVAANAWSFETIWRTSARDSICHMMLYGRGELWSVEK